MPWTVKLEGGPRRVNHAAVPVHEKIYSFGGYCTGDDYKRKRPIDVHVLNTVNYRWNVLKTPEANQPQYYDIPYQRYGHTAVVYNELVYVWGGRNDDAACNVLFCFDTTTHLWSRPKVSGDIPGARDGHSACVINSCMYIFGGYEEETDQFSQDVHMLNLKTLEWSYIKTKGEPPSYRDFHSATPIGHLMYIFGGRGNLSGPHHSQDEVYCDQIVYFDTRLQKWHRPEVSGWIPVGRRSLSAFCYKGCLFVFGGYNGIQMKHYNDLLRYDPNVRRWSIIKPRGIGPCPRRRQSCCVIGDRVFLFGGTSPHPSSLHYNQEALLQNGFEFDENDAMESSRLMDHNDLFVLDFAPSLKTLGITTVLEHKWLLCSIETLPKSIRLEIQSMTTPNSVSRPLHAG